MTKPSYIRCAELAMERASAAALSDFRRGVPSLATVAAAASLFGLVGTVVGVPGSFVGCGADKGTCLAALVAGLAESLYPCAWGLLLGIVAFTGYHHLLGRIEGLAQELRIASAALPRTLQR